MESNCTKSSTNTPPFVDLGLLMNINHQIEAKRPEERYRDYKMRGEHIDSVIPPITSSEERTLSTLEVSEDERLSLETLSDTEETPKIIQETRAEAKKRRRQEFLDNYDVESCKLVVDDLLESQIRYYAVLRRCGLVPVQAKENIHHKEDTWSETSEDPAPRHGNFSSNLPISQSSIKEKNPKLSHSENNVRAIGKSGPGVAKKGHVAKKQAIINKKDMFELMFKGMEHCSGA
ncbi:uncharacterized protein EAE97_007062 [Botrytis byssoidea]|uniref:Uncharacterized protein n=1 Tax=Botrytis byssoidea TaxID=139641 RepID=A0A9P5IN94_9HELO|nr:uncharacterized protein EAE97_007062 [Botrytis byssoidea]KAF7940877.1 hypothetical protein EAE97_007062 [Botrytis byssoidea]